MNDALGSVRHIVEQNVSQAALTVWLRAGLPCRLRHVVKVVLTFFESETSNSHKLPTPAMIHVLYTQYGSKLFEHFFL